MIESKRYTIRTLEKHFTAYKIPTVAEARNIRDMNIPDWATGNITEVRGTVSKGKDVWELTISGLSGTRVCNSGDYLCKNNAEVIVVEGRVFEHFFTEA